MKKVQILIFSTVAILLFSGCNKEDVIQHTLSPSIQTSVSTENQNDEISALKQRVSELETELQQRVGHLENYFDRRTPESVAKLWCEAIRTRNGALQYALFSEELKDKKHDDFVSISWHTGVSNPHVTGFTIDKPIQSEDGQTLIKVILRYEVSGGDPFDGKCILTLKQTQKEINDDWYITSLKDEF